MASKQARMQACKLTGKHESMQANRQAGKRALKRHSVGAMPCRGLFINLVRFYSFDQFEIL